MHKGFKCLDIAAGRVYISRDVVFVEDVYPFSKLHPHAGARLRSELLLPPTLLNPSSSSGDNTTSDQFDNSSLLTNPVHEIAGSAENLASNEAETAQNRRHFMSPAHFPFLAGTNTDSNADHPADSSALPSESALDRTVSSSAPTAPAVAPGSSSPRAPSGLEIATVGGHGGRHPLRPMRRDLLLQLRCSLRLLHRHNQELQDPVRWVSQWL